MSWRAGPEKPRLSWCWECGRKLYGRVHATIIGEDGADHVVHKTCVLGRRVVARSTTVRQ